MLRPPAVPFSRLLRPGLRCAPALLVTLLLAACGGGGGEGIIRTPETPASISLSPPSPLTLPRGATVALSATVTGSSSAVRWRSANPAVATVVAENPSTTARLTTVAAGTTSIVAELADQATVSATLVVTVSAAPAATVTLTPPNATVAVGETAVFAAQLGGPAGAEGRLASCTSSAAAVATVQAVTTAPIGCRATAVAPGSATITAVLDNGNAAAAQLTVQAGRNAIRNLVVTPAAPTVDVGASLDLQVEVERENGNVTLQRTFASSAAAIVGVSDQGRVTGVAPGTANVTVTITGSGGGTLPTTLSQVVPVTVRALPPSLRGLTLTPRTADVAVGRTLPLTLTADRADPGITVVPAFVSRTPAVATVSTTGVVSGVAPGTAVIVASATGMGTGFAATTLTDSMTVTVRALPPAITNLRVTPASPTVPRGQTVALVPRVDSANASVRTTFSYASSAPAVAQVSGTGVVTGVAPGTATITVTATATGTDVLPDTLRLAVPVTVIERPAISNVRIAPDSAFLFIGTSRQVTVAYDSVPDARVTRSYATLAVTTASVTTNGLIVGNAAGVTGVVVTVTGSSPTASTVTVVDTIPVGVWRLTVPAALNVAWGTTATITPTFAGGFPGIPVTVRWRTNNPQVATVTDAGLVTGVGAGNTSIVAIPSLDTLSTGNFTVVTVPCRPTLTVPAATVVTDSVTRGDCTLGTSAFSRSLAFTGVATQQAFLASSPTTASWRPNLGGAAGNDAWRLSTGAGGNRVSVVIPAGQTLFQSVGSGPGVTTPSGRFTVQQTTGSQLCDFIYTSRNVTWSGLLGTCEQRVFLNPRVTAATTLTLIGSCSPTVPFGFTTAVRLRFLDENGSLVGADVTIPYVGPATVGFTRQVAAPPGLYEARWQIVAGNFQPNFSCTFTVNY